MTERCMAVLLSMLIALSCIPVSASAAAEDQQASTEQTVGKLQNGSFEKPVTGSWFKQVNQSLVPSWNTTADTAKIEFFMKTQSYVSGKVWLNPTEGIQAVELNADEESSLYQIVDTEPSSLYEWGLDHGARTDSDTMALIIGPDQPVAPSKNWGEGYETADLDAPNPPLRTGYKYGKDQMMQMVAWLKATGEIQSTTNNNGIANDGQAIVLYSKKFAEHGGFADNADGQPFSMTPSSVYTEKWCIWLMTDHKATSGTNPWGSYGMNAEASGGSSSEVDLSKYYLYTVPSGQTKSIFAFTSVENAIAPGRTALDPTYGNFLDNVNFELYHSLSGSTTAHGSAVVGNSDGSVSGEEVTGGYAVSVGNSVATYVSDGQTLKIQAKVAGEDRSTVSFVGVYCTVQNATGTGSTTSFISAKNDAGWTSTADASGNLWYTYSLENVTSAVSLHFVFIKSPLITYDVNGGKEYSCTPTGSNSATEAANVYSFKPTEQDGITYADPYLSHLPEGQTDAWKFMGWKLFDDNGAVDDAAIGTNGLLQGIHTIACNYEQKTTEGVAEVQNFVIIGEGGVFTPGEKTVSGQSWSTDASVLYDSSATGLSLVAQWRWRQTFVPQTNAGSGYADSDAGGTVSVTSAASGENYDEEYSEEGAKAYYAGTGETVTAVATPEAGYSFDGWYDENGNQVGSDPLLSYVELKENVKTCYARFSRKITQQFKRQIQDENGDWITLSEDDTRVPALDHVSLSEGIGTVVSSTATNNASYGIIGWYDEYGNPVDESMICNDGKSIRYAVSEAATYYARYTQAVTIHFEMQYVDTEGNIKTVTSTTYGSLSVSSVNAIPGDVVSSKAYAAVGYTFDGWYDGAGAEAEQVTQLDASDAKIIVPTATAENDVIYYARFSGKTDTAYKVQHTFVGYIDGTTNQTNTYTYYGTTGEQVTPSALSDLSAYPGYVYQSGITTKAIAANGSTVFTLTYTKTPVSLTYDKNAADASGSVDAADGFVGWNVAVTQDSFDRAGFRFNGWNTDPKGNGTSYAPGEDYLMQAGTNVLYAQWVAENSVAYQVQHIKLNELGEAAGIEAYTYHGAKDATVTATAKTYEGYSAQCDQEGTPITSVSGRITVSDTGEGTLVLKLYYTPNATTLTYKANGGIGSDNVANGVVGEVLAVKDGSLFTRPGYDFVGWKTPSGKTPGSTYTLTTGNDVLLAQWQARTDTAYTILHYTVSADGASSTLVQTESKTGTTGLSVTAGALTMDGYTYRSDFNANGMVGTATGVIAGDGGLVLKLYYVPNAVKLIYDANGGIGDREETTGRVSAVVSVAENPFTRLGYTFNGWSTQPTPGAEAGTTYQPHDNYTLGATDGVLYAQWTADAATEYTVEHYILNAQGTEATLSARESKYGTTDAPVTAQKTTIQGYTYQADYKNGDLEAVTSGNIAGDGSLVLKLYYMPNAAHLFYYPNDGSDKDFIDQGYVDETKTVKANMFSRDGYTFYGWNTKEDGTGTSYQADNAFVLTANQNQNVLYAQWEPVPTYNHYCLTYHANGGTGAPENQEADSTILVSSHDFTVSAVEPVRDGYTFAGWQAEGAVYQADDTIAVGAGQTVELVARWVENPVEPVLATLIYQANGGIGDNVSANGNVGDSVEVSDNPFTRDGYTFLAWSTTPDSSGTLYAPGAEYTLTGGDDVLYALWEQIPEPPAPDPVADVLIYKANGGDGTDVSINGYVGDEKAVLANPFGREGYHFIGWNTDAAGTGTGYTQGDSYTLTAGEDILYAQWEQDPVTPPDPPMPDPVADVLIYKANGGDGTDVSINGYVGDETSVFANPFGREGYHFIGWNTDAAGTGTGYTQGDSYTLTAGEDILYAQWEQDAEQTPDPSSPTKPGSGLETGDTANPLLWCSLVTLSLAGMFVGTLWVKQKKRRK